MANERENNNTKENADEVYFDTPTTGKLQSVNDIDVFKVYVDEAMRIHFEFDVPAAVRYHWDVTIKNDQGDIINSAMNMRVGRSDYEGTDIYAYVREKGFYYIFIEQDKSSNWSDREYEFTLKKLTGYFSREYEGNNERSTANVLTLDGDNGTIEKIDTIYSTT